MGNDEFLHSISDMMDEKLTAFGRQMDEKFDHVNKRLDFIAFKQERMGKQLIDINMDVPMAEKDIKRDIRYINDTLETLVKILRGL